MSYKLEITSEKAFEDGFVSEAGGDCVSEKREVEVDEQNSY